MERLARAEVAWRAVVNRQPVHLTVVSACPSLVLKSLISLLLDVVGPLNGTIEHSFVHPKLIFTPAIYPVYMIVSYTYHFTAGYQVAP